MVTRIHQLASADFVLRKAVASWYISNSSLDQNFLRSTFQMSGIVRTQKSRV